MDAAREALLDIEQIMGQLDDALHDDESAGWWWNVLGDGPRMWQAIATIREALGLVVTEASETVWIARYDVTIGGGVHVVLGAATTEDGAYTLIGKHAANRGKAVGDYGSGSYDVEEVPMKGSRADRGWSGAGSALNRAATGMERGTETGDR